MSLFDLEMLVGWVGQAAIDHARQAMDVQSVTHFEFDKRGRLQAGVKPAPPSQEKSSYVKISIRGRRSVVDCRTHGKGKWCLHSVILALYHLGIKPQYEVRKSKVVDNKPRRLGFRLEVEFNEEGAGFRLRSLSTGQSINQPLAYLKREPGILKWSGAAHDVLADLADVQGNEFWISRTDLAGALSAIEGRVLYPHESENAFDWQTSSISLPKISIKIKADKLMWRATASLPENCIYVPGRPGFTLVDGVICRRAYVPDFQVFGSGMEGELPLSADLLALLLNEKHLLEWVAKQPQRLEHLPTVGIRLEVENRNLVGKAGFWLDESFYALTNWQAWLQWLPSKKGDLLLQTHPGAMNRFAKAMQAIRAPWQNGGFNIREQAAPAFLKNLRLGPDLRLDRESADQWFGMTPLAIDTHWDDTSLAPSYRIGGEDFQHSELLKGALSDSGLRMADGRLLNVDFGEIQTNQRLIAGVAAIHETVSAQQALLARIRGEAEARRPEATLGELWTRQLRGYQVEGVRWLLNRVEQNEPALLADDMGLGKTIQTLALLDTIRNDKPQLVVVPRSLLANWSESCETFCEHRKVTIHHGNRRADCPDQLAARDVVLTTYGTVLRDADLLYEVEFQIVVLDEAQAIKNPDAQTSQAVFELWAEHRLALTGTPIENRLLELWSIFQFLAPGYLGDQDEVKGLPGPGTPAFDAFRMKVKPFLLRRLKGEVAKELPPKQELVLRVPLSQAQNHAYRQVLQGARQEFETTKPSTMGILTKLLRLRQICCHLGLVDETALQSISAKFQVLFEHLEEIIDSGHSALIFSQFTQLLGLLKFELEERDWRYLYLDGKTQHRQKLVHRFQAGEAPLFLISLKAGGTGLNLTRAGYVFHLDPWWNPMVMTQATDRAHRIGQTQTVMSYKIIAADTIEEDILKLQASKQLLAEGVWQDPDALFQTFDQETLLGLLQ